MTVPSWPTVWAEWRPWNLTWLLTHIFKGLKNVTSFSNVGNLTTWLFSLKTVYFGTSLRTVTYKFKALQWHNVHKLWVAFPSLLNCFNPTLSVISVDISIFCTLLMSRKFLPKAWRDWFWSFVFSGKSTQAWSQWKAALPYRAQWLQFGDFFQEGVFLFSVF